MSKEFDMFQVAGNHSDIYEAYYNVVDPKGFGSVNGMDAARFLKKSGLSDVILSKVWDLSDPGGRGCLDKTGMFVALKLVALVQNGKDLNVSNVNMEVPPPKMGDVPIKPMKPPPPRNTIPPNNTPLITSLPPSAVDWTVKPAEREKYDKLFDSLQPMNGLIPGNKVKNVLMESKLPFETLGKIWDLADQDKDGMLDRHEFISAMHLVYKALEKHAIPNTLPSELMPPVKRKGSTPMGGPLLTRGLDGVKPELPPLPSQAALTGPAPVPALVAPTPMPALGAPAPVAALVGPQITNLTQQQQTQPTQPIKPIQSVQPTIPWVVTNDEKAKSDALFIKSDIDKDGFVSGQEIKDVFLQSGVPQAVLAHIWALCDIKQSGKLNNEQFALAMWFVARCLKGIEPPPALTPDMVPPSFRSIKPADGLVENNNTRYSNPELDMISKDIEELSKEKLMLETDIAQKEADIKIKNGEIKNLQSELDTLAATLKQLENQKGEAQKRLNDLRAQQVEFDTEMDKVNRELEAQLGKVDKLRAQAAEQAETVAVQESELNSKKEQLEGLRQEEQRLEREKSENVNKLQNLTTNLQDTQLSISQAKALITQLQEQTRQMNDAIQACDSAIEAGDATTVPDTALRIQPDFRDPEYSKVGLVNGNSNKQNGFGDAKDDPFSNNQNGPLNTGFNEDLFKNDPFKNSDAFGSSDPFNSAFPNSNDGFAADPFGGSSFNAQPTTNQDPFDAFGDSRKSSTADITATAEDKDPFGCDPFAVLHAPTRDGTVPQRPTSPSPALPPKKSKQPPPRPAPPRPTQPPSLKKDAFGNSDPFAASGGGGFADFANFDAKFSNNKPTGKVTPQSMSRTTAMTTTAPPPTKGLDFTDDPFRDYRYEDPFNITFDDEDATTTTTTSKSSPIIAKAPSITTTKSDRSTDSLDAFGLTERFDPFGLSSLSTSTTNNNNNNNKLISDGRQSVPLPNTLPFLGGSNNNNNNNNNSNISGSNGGAFGNNNLNILNNNNNNSSNNKMNSGGRASAPIMSEDAQLAWAARESLKLEEDRKKRQLQEQADLELAISLSKAENKK